MNQLIGFITAIIGGSMIFLGIFAAMLEYPAGEIITYVGIGFVGILISMFTLED